MKTAGDATVTGPRPGRQRPVRLRHAAGTAEDAVLRYRRGEAFERQAHMVLRERAECRTYEAWSRSPSARCAYGGRCPVSSR